MPGTINTRFIAMNEECQANGADNMKQKFTASTWEEDKWVVAQCIEVDVASQGKNEDEALENLRDALELHFTPPVATRSLQVPDFSDDSSR